MSKQRILFWVVLLVAVLAGLWWICYFRYKPMRLYRAVPDSAIVITEHLEPASRWGGMLDNPLLQRILVEAGADRADIRDLADDPLVTGLVSRLARRHVVTGYSPSLLNSGIPAFVFASWVGVYGQFLKWGFFNSWLDDFEPLRLDGGRRAWVMQDEEAGITLTLAVSEGVLLGCVCRDPIAMQLILDRLERGFPPLPMLVDDASGSGAERDRFWIRHRRRDENGFQSEIRTYRGGISALDAESLGGWIEGEFRNCDSEQVAAVEIRSRTREIDNLVGHSASAMVVAPLDCVPRLLGTGNRHVEFAVETVRTIAASNALTSVALLDGSYSGRLLGLRVPSVVVAVQIGSDEETLTRLESALDNVNARYGLSLIPRWEVVEDQRMLVLDGARMGIYSSLGPRERIAMARWKGWLLIVSNADSLKQLLQADTLHDADAAWRERAQRITGPVAWIDFDRAGTALKQAMAVYSLSLIVRQNRGNALARERVRMAERFLDALSAFGHGMAWMPQGAETPRIVFELGKAPPAD